jgi:hypothetical protein
VSRVRILAVWFGVSFVLHFVWEHVQMPLYGLQHVAFWDGVWICLFATATGDMLFMLIIYAAIASAEHNAWWPRSAGAYRHASTWLLPLLLGVLLSVSYELWAVYVAGRWTYSDAMPLVPIVRVGVSPLAQMMVIPLATVAVLRRSIPPSG